MICPFTTSLSAQHFVFGNLYECPNTDKEQFSQHQAELEAVLKEMMDADSLYMYMVNTNQKKDTLEAMVALYAPDEPAFRQLTNTWKSQATEAGSFLENNCKEIMSSQLAPDMRYFPLVKYKFTDVKEIANIDYVPDNSISYNIIIDLTGFTSLQEDEERPDYSELNFSIVEIGRFINLHAGAGIPEDKLDIVVAVHGYATQSFLTDEAYEKKHSIPNPNGDLIRELKKHGVRFIICAQSMRGITREELMPEAEVSFTSQAVLTEYQLKGYALKIMNGD